MRRVRTYWPLVLSIGMNLPWLVRVYSTRDGSSFSLLTQAMYLSNLLVLLWSYRRQRGLPLAETVVRLAYSVAFTLACILWGGGV